METLKGPFGENLIFKKQGLQALLKKKNHFFFFDELFKKRFDFSKNENVFFVKPGEDLKTLQAVERHVSWLLEKKANKTATLVAVGGGSVGDSIGFLASVYLRGVRLVHVPTTWLAAVDSSIGGKTALNFNSYKNQIGSVYAPSAILFFEELISTSKIEDSEGEILKTLLLNINAKWAKLILNSWEEKKISFNDLHSFVSYKAKIVKKDPFDDKGVRAILNLGHTLGHALELSEKLSHSDAVKKGLAFSLEWSFKKKMISEKNRDKFKSLLTETGLPNISPQNLRLLILRDKKSLEGGGKLNFIFPTDKGPLVKVVSISSLVLEYQRQVK